MALYEINVKPEGKKFRLYNHDNPCGDRLYHGSDKKDKAQQWPFRIDNWMVYETKSEAVVAAEKLQSYLEARENALHKKQIPAPYRSAKTP